MDASAHNDALDSILERIGTAGRPAASGDTGEYRRPLAVGEWLVSIEEFANNPNAEAIWNVATAELRTTPNFGVI